MAYVEWTDVGERSFVAVARFVARQDQDVRQALLLMERVEARCRLTADFPAQVRHVTILVVDCERYLLKVWL